MLYRDTRYFEVELKLIFQKSELLYSRIFRRVVIRVDLKKTVYEHVYSQSKCSGR